jgi:hypothetical protein
VTLDSRFQPSICCVPYFRTLSGLHFFLLNKRFQMRVLAKAGGSEVAKVLPNPLHCCPGLRSSPGGFAEASRPTARSQVQQHPITVTEWRPAAPGLSHLLFQGFFRDSVRKRCHHLLLYLLPYPDLAGLRWPLPIHLTRFTATPLTKWATSLLKLQFSERPVTHFPQRHPMGGTKV